MSYVIRKLGDIEYSIPTDVYDNYLVGLAIHEIDDNNCSVVVESLNQYFDIPISILEAVESVGGDGVKILDELFKLKDFPKEKFLSQRPPSKHIRIERKSFWERLFT